MVLGALSRDMDTVKLLMEGRPFPSLQRDLSEIMQDTASAMVRESERDQGRKEPEHLPVLSLLLPTTPTSLPLCE